MSAIQPETTSHPRTHLDLYDRDEVQALARDLGVTEDELKEAVRVFGRRISTLRGCVGRKAPMR
ncbi:DUF3606 domain-containing protein [Methylobacterium sp. JK268]